MASRAGLNPDSGGVRSMLRTLRSPRRRLLLLALLWTLGMGTWLLLYRQQAQTCGVDAFRYCYFGLPLKVGLGRTGIVLLWAAGLAAIGATMLFLRVGVGDVLAGAVRSAAAIRGVDASFATLDVDAKAVLVVSAGLSTAEVEREREIACWPEAPKQPLLRSVNGSRLGDVPIQSRLAVHFGTGPPGRGSLVILMRSSERRFGAAEQRRFGELAERVGRRLERARTDVPF